MNTLLTALLINPPGRLFQRGEDRSQGNIEDSSATSLRAPNDLAYMAAVLRETGVRPAILDYPAEKKSWRDFENDFRAMLPDLLIVSMTNATVFEDLQACAVAKRIRPETLTVAKGALFLTSKIDLYQQPLFHPLDYALTGESETIIGSLVKAITGGQSPEAVRGILYRDPSGTWKRTAPAPFVEDLDSIPFPARDLLKNELYLRPDTGEPQATIQTSRGCAASCIFCLTPVISGNRIRVRSAANIADEVEECVRKYNIRNFFFKADTFTMNKPHVIGLCREIIARKLNIQWVANSRADTLDEERLEWMKRAGCWLVAVGFESGDDESLKNMQKNTTVEQAFRAAYLMRKYGLKLYGFFMIGLPWEDRSSVERTLMHAKKLKCDYAEIHIAVPFEGTELHRIADQERLIPDQVQGHDYFRDPVMRTMFLSRDELLRYRRTGIRKIFLTPGYVMNRLRALRSSREFVNHFRYGLRLLRQVLKSSGKGNL